MFLSIVSTLYKSSGFLEEFCERVTTAASQLTDEYELLLVNDGSPDDSLQCAIALKEKFSQIRVIDLSRNFGHHNAALAGLKHCRGERVFLIDSDLETPPEALLEFWHEMERGQDLDVVYGFQESRKGDLFERITGAFFWRILNWLSDTHVPPNVVTERLMTRRYLDSLLKLGDFNLFLGGMMYWVGYKQLGVPVRKRQRKGKSTYSVTGKISLLVNAISSFSGKPLKLLFWFGLSVSAVSFSWGGWIVVSRLILGNQHALGWSSIIVVSLAVLGILSTFLGIMGIYLHKVFSQVQGRPNFIVKREY